jgi:hypothetical protein
MGTEELEVGFPLCDLFAKRGPLRLPGEIVLSDHFVLVVTVLYFLPVINKNIYRRIN